MASTSKLLEEIHQQLAGLTRRVESTIQNDSENSDQRVPATSVKLNYVRDVILARRLRERFFGADLFGEPGWDLILDLYIRQLEGKKTNVSSACLAAAVPATTALRWINAMVETGVLTRTSDPNDRRKVYLWLSDRALAAMEEYLNELARRCDVFKK